MAEKKIKDPSIGKLGKLKAKKDKRTLSYSDYVMQKNMPAIPTVCSYTKKQKARWGMMDNYDLCDCTCAAAGHMIQCWTLNTGEEVTLPNKKILKAYEAISGYNPKTKKHDDGASMLDLLNYWRKKGVGGYKIIAFASINHADKKQVKEVIYLYGGIYAGLKLPKSIKGQSTWEVPATGLKGKGKPNSLGGHAVAVLDYDDKGVTCITWGQKKKMTWAFWEAYAEEAYVALSTEFFKGKRSPVGLDLAAMEKTLLKITKEKIRLRSELGNKKAADKAPAKRASPAKAAAAGKSPSNKKKNMGFGAGHGSAKASDVGKKKK